MKLGEIKSKENARDDSVWVFIWVSATASCPPLLLTGSLDETARLSDISGSKKLVFSVVWSPDGKQLACGSLDGTISVFDVPRANFLHHLECHFMPVQSLVFFYDLRLRFMASDNGNVHMYDAKGKALVETMSGHASWVLCVDVSPDRVAIAIGSSDRSVRLWDLSMRASVQTMSNHADQVWGVTFRPLGRSDVRGHHLASVSDDKMRMNKQAKSSVIEQEAHAITHWFDHRKEVRPLFGAPGESKREAPTHFKFLPKGMENEQQLGESVLRCSRTEEE